MAAAATLTNESGTVTYNGADDPGEVLMGPTGAPGQVFVFAAAGVEPITSSDCPAASGGGFRCDGVTTIMLSGNGGGDSLDPSDDLTQPVTADGGAGEDRVGGGGNNDTLRGGPGDDSLHGGSGADDLSGGSGIDDASEGGYQAQDVSITLDDLANDGVTGEGDNVHSDVENITGFSAYGVYQDEFGVVRMVGDAAANTLTVTSGYGDIDGGPGNDSLNGGQQNDTIDARDGYADRVTCGPGKDIANVDSLDQVADDCETVNSVDAGNANQDHQPTVAWTSPAENATLPTTRATTLSVNASDDKSLTKVQFLAGNRIVCEDTTAPYSCPYTPNGADSGKQVLTAIAIDSAQQTATAIRAVKIARFSPKISEKLSPSRDTKAPYRFRVTGTLTPPTGMSKSEACGAGVIATSVKAGKKTISTRRVNLKSNCTYSTTAAFRNGARFGNARRLKIAVRFGGNAVLVGQALPNRYVRVR